MQFRMFSKSLATVLVAGVIGVCADQVKLANGSVIVGTVKQILGGKATVATDFAGELTIDAAKIQAVVTDAPVNIHATEGAPTTNGVLTDAGQKSAASTTPVDYKAVAMWPAGGKDPTVKDTSRKWSYEVFVDLAGKTGNTEKFTGGMGAKATLTGPEDKFVMMGSTKYAKENGVENERQTVFGLDYERHIAETKNTWYARTTYKYDKYADLDPDWTSAAGYGFYMIDKEDVKIRGRLGLAYIYRDFISDKEHESSMGMDAGYHHEIKLRQLGPLKDIGTLVTDVTYTPQFDNFHDYHIYHESSLSIPLGGSKVWSLRLGVSNDYYSRVAKDKDRLDTTYFARLVLTLQ